MNVELALIVRINAEFVMYKASPQRRTTFLPNILESSWWKNPEDFGRVVDKLPR